MTLGVIFFLMLLFAFYLFIFDPFNIKPFIFGGEETIDVSQNAKTQDDETSADDKPFLSTEQKKSLESFGIDQASLPSTITVTQEKCFKTKLGEARFAEISAGASPSISEFLNAKSCL